MPAIIIHSANSLLIAIDIILSDSIYGMYSLVDSQKYARMELLNSSLMITIILTIILVQEIRDFSSKALSTNASYLLYYYCTMQDLFQSFFFIPFIRGLEYVLNWLRLSFTKNRLKRKCLPLLRTAYRFFKMRF
jgi:hypothetical protein